MDQVGVTIWGMSQIDHLYRLQLLDDEIREGKERLSDVLRLQAESPKLFAARERVEVTEAELQQRRTSQNDLNLELSSLNTKSKRSEDRLYSGIVKNPKELADIQQEIESLGRRRAVLEDEVLEAMIFWKMLKWRAGTDGVQGTADDQYFRSLEASDPGVARCAFNSDEAALLAYLRGGGRITVESRFFSLSSRGWGPGARGICEVQAILDKTGDGRAKIVEMTENWLN